MSSRATLPLLALALAAAPTLAHAQDAPRQAISINPIGAVFEFYSAEFERSVTRNASLGLSSSYWGGGVDDVDGSAEVSYLAFDAKARYYPSGAGLHGFSLGGTVGYTSLAGSFTDSDGSSRGRANAVSMGVALDHNWLLGDRNRFLVAAGLGAKRLFPVGIESDGVTIAYPTARLSVGFAF